jgi:fucose permease
MAAGRFLSSAVKNLTAIGVRVIGAAAVVSLVCILILIWTESAGIATLAIVLTGLAFAPIFPTVVGVTFAKFDPSQYGSIFGIIFAIGLLGNTLVQQGIGKVTEAGTVQDGLKVVAGMALLLVLVGPALGVGRKAAS